MESFESTWKRKVYVSATICSYRASVDYKLGKYTMPKRYNGPLCVFKTRQDARKFRKRENSSTDPYKLILAKCEYVPVSNVLAKDDGIWYMNISGTKVMAAMEPWHLPYGTFLAKKVKITRIGER